MIDLERIGARERRALAYLDDSKQKSVEEREALYPHVIRAAACVTVAVRSVRAIDTRGLHVSNMGALSDCMRTVADAGQEDVSRLVDGFTLHELELDHHRVIHGDARSAAIAAASVIAKVTRDRYMHRAAATFPRWNFEGNVGYSTPDHRDAIREHGICPLHRRSFASIAYTQLELGGEEIDAVGLEPQEGPVVEPVGALGSEGASNVIDIRSAPSADADPDDVEAVAGDS
jgi:ribonuclease HII